MPARKSLRKTDSKSAFTPALKSLLDNLPDPNETAGPVIRKRLEACWSFFRRGGHERFLLAWNVGKILSAVREKCPHGNSKAAKDGALTWEQWAEEFTPFDCYETADRWADIWDYIQPTTVNDFDALDYGAARAIVAVRKGEQSRATKRKNGKTAESEEATSKVEDKDIAKPPQPIGNTISTVRNWSAKMLDSVAFHGAHSSHQSPLRDGDKLKSWIADNLLSVEKILAATETLNNHMKGLLGGRHEVTRQGAKIIREARKQFKTAHDAFLKLSPPEGK